MKYEFFSVVGTGKALQCVIKIVVINGGEVVECPVPSLFYPVALWRGKSFMQEAFKEGFCGIHAGNFAFIVFGLTQRHPFTGEAFGIINDMNFEYNCGDYQIMIEVRIFFILFASLYIVAKLDSVDSSNS